jgi:predicted DNA binding CopG/RHH family protein
LGDLTINKEKEKRNAYKIVKAPANFDTITRKKQKLIHSTYRIKEEIIRAVEREATKRGVPTSSLVNKILENYVTSEMYFEQLGFILVSKDFLRKVFSKIEKEKDIEEFGYELGVTTAKEYVSYFFPQVNGRTLVHFLDLWFKRFQSFHHRVDNDNPELHYFTVIHEINMNFSIALKMILEGLIIPIVKKDLEFRYITANAISFSFEAG